MFKSYQNDSAVLRRYDIDFGGNPSLVESINVELDVQFQSRRIYNNEGEEITTSATCFVTPNSSLNEKTVSQLKQQWKLFYDGEELQVEKINRVRKPAEDVIDHYEFLLK